MISPKLRTRLHRNCELTFAGAERSLGSSGVADSGCRLISQARLISRAPLPVASGALSCVELGALLIGRSVVKEQYGARRESRDARSVRSISQTRLISRARSISQAPLAVDAGSPVRVASGALSRSTLGALSSGPKTAPTHANSFRDCCLLWKVRMPEGSEGAGVTARRPESQRHFPQGLELRPRKARALRGAARDWDCAHACAVS